MADEIKPGQEPIPVTEGEEITIAAVEEARTAPEEPEEKPAETVEEPVREVKAEVNDDETPVTKGKFQERFKEVYAQNKEYERRLQETERRLAEAQGKQPPTSEAMTDAEKQALQAEFLADPAAFLTKFGKKNRDEIMKEVEAKQAEFTRTNDALQADAWLSQTPEAKNDPDFNDKIAAIIKANPGLTASAKQGMLSPSQMAEFVYAKYHLTRAEQLRQQTTEEVKANRVASGVIAKSAVASASGPGAGGKRTWKTSEIASLPDSEYNRLESELDAAEREGRIVAG